MLQYRFRPPIGKMVIQDCGDSGNPVGTVCERPTIDIAATLAARHGGSRMRSPSRRGVIVGLLALPFALLARRLLRMRQGFLGMLDGFLRVL